MRPLRLHHAFTLIELLVTIAIIAVLVGILLPALASARKNAAMAAEQAAGRQVVTAFTAYAVDNRDKIMPGYLRGLWANPGRTYFLVYGEDGAPVEENRLTGTPIRPHTWRLMPYADYAIDGIVLDKNLRRTIRDLPRDQAAPRSYYAAIGRNPTFGMNTTWIGGDAHRGAFFQPALTRWGAYYRAKMSDPMDAGKLLAFASARGTLPDDGPRVPGYHRVEAPWRATPTSNSVPAWYKPMQPRKFDPTLDTTVFGHVDYRYFDKAVTAMMDGHVESLGLSDLSDMRRWASKATGADWHP